jgi:hypothetical protein
MQIAENGNSLLIRLTYQGKRKSFSLAHHNNPVGYAAANMKIAQMQRDIDCENFLDRGID